MGRAFLSTVCVCMMGFFNACNSEATETPNVLDQLGIVAVKIGDHPVAAWLADNDAERQKGLMFVTAAEMAPRADQTERGMLFVFPHDERNGFWMRNTIIDLDIAFIRADGTIVQTFTMKALDETSHTPSSAYRYALEVRSGVFQRLGITAGGHVEIPESALKQSR